MIQYVAFVATLLGYGICAAVGITGTAQQLHVERQQVSAIDRSTLTGKLFVGYQGWFRKPGEGNGNSHWTT